MIQLLCLPFAGAGASFFSPWQDADDAVRVRALQLPGRERRIAEDPYEDVHEAADGLLADLELGDEAVALFGHSLGAILAYELTRRLRSAGHPVVHLFVSGSGGPQKMRQDRASGLDDEEFLLKVEQFAGYRHEVLDDPEMRELILPALRADVEMHESYRPLSTDPVDVAITAIRGDHDDLVSAAQTAEWAAVTSAGFRQAELPGGHMYLTESPGPVLSLVAKTVAVAAADR